ncbi:galactose ABC transporter substrate-binding protein [Clostridium beijerinckii]|uniref:D-galactose/methyl-galactoside binding periplasmic protein MglB n=1 Tax=Clostridium beijerinckii TaxID=1520 RepID=A0AAX0AV97_CLOBE|nr:galactose ABC transporter substrate-binding protein [Clostridium beijerinckii]NRT86866.1 methyl-galactoside transport system substrate-binding protein [Clostridium beijerinckii]NYC72298.1 methyl-galactoside transport system substrate-binding protein [Clostridium beijerinckii]
MWILKKVLAMVLLINITVKFTEISTFYSLNLNNKNTANIAVLLYTFDPFMSSLKQSLETIQKDNSDKIKFTFFDGKNNIALQNETIDSISKNDFDLILANLADTSENFVEDIVFNVKSKNLPIVFLDIDPKVVSKVSKYYDKAAFILANSDLAGTVQGKILVNLWNSNKSSLDKNNDNTLQYILLHGQAKDPVTIDRTKYAISTISNSGINTEQLALVNANWLKSLSKDSIESLFLRYDGKIEAIISNNDDMAIGAVEALQKYGYNKGEKSKNIAIVGIDGIPEAKSLIDKGFMAGTVIQDPKVLAEVFYNVGMNLVNNLSPTENTNYNVVDGEIIVPFPYEEYIKK